MAAMRTNDELIEEELRADPTFRAEWKRTALGRTAATALVRYRAERDLSQRDLAERLRMTVAQVARLEAGDINPSCDTVARVSSLLGIEFITGAGVMKSRIAVAEAGGTVRHSCATVDPDQERL